MVKQAENLNDQVEYYANLPYTITIEQRNDQGTYYVARVVELPDLFMVGDTPGEAVSDLFGVKKEWLGEYLKLGNKIPMPLKLRNFSGQIRLRVPPTLHEKMALLAELEDISLNQYMLSALSAAVGMEVAKSSRNSSDITEASNKLKRRYNSITVVTKDGSQVTLSDKR